MLHSVNEVGSALFYIHFNLKKPLCSSSKISSELVKQVKKASPYFVNRIDFSFDLTSLVYHT